MKIVLFVSGFRQSMQTHDYASTLRTIERAGYTTRFVPIDWSRTTIEHWVAELQAAYAGYAASEVILAGFSFGAMAALVAAATRNPSELWLCSLAPYFAEDLRRCSDTELIKDVGVHRAAVFRDLEFASLAKQVTCRTLLFLGEAEAARWPTLDERVMEAHRLLSGSIVVRIPGTQHDVTAQSYRETIAAAITSPDGQ